MITAGLAGSAAVRTLSADAARRTALAAQGFTDPRPTGAVTRRHLGRVMGRVQLLQMDSVNVAVRAHYVPLFSRLGAYPRELLDEAAWPTTAAGRRRRSLVEVWSHEACLVPVEDWPALGATGVITGHRGYPDLAARRPSLLDDVLAAVAETGPIGAGALERLLGAAPRHGAPPRPRPPGATWWERSDVKRACEHLFATGELSVGGRRHFERLYDLPENVLPPHVLRVPAPDPAEAARALVERAAAAHGVATEADLRDYWRMSPGRHRAAVDELVAEGVLVPVEVTGWSRPAYLHAGARTPRRVTGRALLCPFDPLVWRRDRAERIFGFRYRIEIYVPQAQRVHGYYVFPFLLDGHLVARVDLKADRSAGDGVLRVQGAFAEPGVDGGRVADELAGELHLMAGWLGLRDVVVAGRGDLASALRGALRGALGPRAAEGRMGA